MRGQSTTPDYDLIWAARPLSSFWVSLASGSQSMHSTVIIDQCPSALVVWRPRCLQPSSRFSLAHSITPPLTSTRGQNGSLNQLDSVKRVGRYFTMWESSLDYWDSLPHRWFYYGRLGKAAQHYMARLRRARSFKRSSNVILSRGRQARRRVLTAP